MAGIGIGIAIIVAILAALATGLYFIFGTVGVLLVFFLVVCIFMMGIILIQKPRGGGLSGAFGGAGGSSQAVFGSRVGDVLTWITVGCFIAFLGLAVGLTYAVRPPESEILNSVQAPPETPEQQLEDLEAMTGEENATPETDVQEITEQPAENSGDATTPATP